MKNNFEEIQNGDIWDALILGAGPSGAMTALKLAEAGWRVLLVDKAAFPREKVCGGFIGPENKTLLQEAGVWDQFSLQEGISLGQMWFTSSRGTSVRLPFETGMGLAVCRKDFDAALIESAQARGVFFAAPIQVEMGSPGTLRLSSPVSMKAVKVFARHVIEARGGSALEETSIMGFGMAAYFDRVRWMKNRVILHFIDEGHFGINPVLGKRVTGCFVATQAMLEKVGKNPDKLFGEFCKQNRFLAGQMKYAKRASAWQGIPIRLSRKPVFHQNGFFRVGDAVATVDPIVGGGMTLALQGAQILAECLTTYAPGQVDEARVISDYSARWKKTFGFKLAVSHVWGKIGHHSLAADGLLRFLGAHRNGFKRLFEWHHSLPPAIV